MENCERYALLLSAWLDGELTAEEERELKAHLAVCPACRAQGSRLAAIHSAFSELEEISAPEGFAGGVMDRLRASEASRPKAVSPLRRPQLKALAGLAACLALCLGVYRAGLLDLGGGASDAAASEDLSALTDNFSPAAAAAGETYPAVERAETDEDSWNGCLEETAPAGERKRASPDAPQRYEIAGHTVDAVLTLPALPEGAEEVLGPETAVFPDEEGRTCYLVSGEQMRALMALAENQWPELEGAATGRIDGERLCAVVLEEGLQ